MREIGLDLDKHSSKRVNEFAGQSFDVRTVCDDARELCPIFSATTMTIQ